MLKYLLKYFNKSRVIITESDDAGLKLEFKHQIGCKNILLLMHIKAYTEVCIDKYVKRTQINMSRLWLKKELLLTI